DALATDPGHVLGPAQVLQRGDRRLRHVDRIRRAEALGEHVADAAELGNLARLAVAEADAVDLVADDDERREREAAAALDDLRDAVDLDDTLLELARLGVFDRAQNSSPPSRAASASAFTRP